MMPSYPKPVVQWENKNLVEPLREYSVNLKEEILMFIWLLCICV